MKRTIRPAEEEIGSVIPVILFSLLWYSSIFGIIFRGGFQTPLLIFLVAGILPLYQVITNIRRAFFYRRQRAEAVALGNVSYGKITGGHPSGCSLLYFRRTQTSEIPQVLLS